MRSDVRIKLQERQAAMRANGGRSPAETPLPVIWIEQLSRSVVTAIKGCLGPKRQVIVDALADALPGAVRHMSEIIISETSTPAERSTASTTLFWVFNCCMKGEQSLARSTARAEVAKKQRARAEAKKSRAVLATAEIPLIIDKKRRAMQKALDKALKTPKGEL
jgi:hypothetical protein